MSAINNIKANAESLGLDWTELVQNNLNNITLILAGADPYESFNQYVAGEDLTATQITQLQDIVTNEVATNNGTKIQPYIASINPSFAKTGETLDIVVNGDNFDTKTSFTAGSATINSITIHNGVKATINVTTGDASETLTIKTDASFGNPSFEVKAETILIPADGTTDWQNIVGVNTGLGYISATSPNGWKKGASFGVVPADTDCLLKFKKGAIGNGRRSYGMFGLSDGDDNQHYTTINYAIYIVANKYVYIYEGGSNKGSKGFVAAGDQLSIERKDGTIRYYINDEEIYKSSTESTSELYFDSSIYANAKITNISLKF